MKNGLLIAVGALAVILIAFIAVFLVNRKYLIMDGPGMVNENPVPASSGKAEGEEAGPPESVPEPKNEGEEEGSMEPIPIVQVRAGDMFFTIELEDNSSAEEFFEKIKNDMLTVEMSDFGGFEKVGNLPWSLTRNDTEITTEPGDLILYEGNKITIYYAENTWKFTKLGKLNGEPEEIRAAFGGDADITAEFSVGWTE